MNFLDRAIGAVAPRFALKREIARATLELARPFLKDRVERLSYEGASAGRRTSGWYAPATDANVELMGSLVWLRNRSRELIRNNPYAVKAVEELVGNAVGTGIVPQAKTGQASLDKLIDNEWPYFVEACDTPQRLDFYGMQALTLRSMAESGESIVRYRPRLAQDNLRVPLQLQLLEADFLDHARTMGTVNGHVMQGVQFDMLGRRVAYWIYTYHPGGVLILNPRGGIISVPVPANQILHSYRVLRPGQVRGVPWLAPVMLAMRDLDDYADAERLRKKIEACIVGLVTQPEGGDGSLLGFPAKDPLTRHPVEQFQPGMYAYLKPGEDVKFNNPTPTSGYREYKTTELEQIAAGVGLPYELMTGDMSKVNFSSWRGGMLGFRNTIENYRWLTLIPSFCMPVRRRFIDTLLLLGKIPASSATSESVNLYGTQWTAPRFESVDPVKDAEAALKDIRMGRMTWFEAVLANGFDPNLQLQQIALFNKLVDKYEIILDCDPRNVTLRGQEQPSNTEERTPSSVAAPAPGAGPAPAPAKTPAKPGTNASTKAAAAALLSDEDLGMVRELLLAGGEARASAVRGWADCTRTYLT
jgi:lambda family phage portal protein